MNWKEVKGSPDELEIRGPGVTVTCVNNALFSIHNHKLPATYQSAAKLQFSNERLTLNLDGNEQVLRAQPAPKIPVNSLVREGRVLAESNPILWTPVEGINVSRTVLITHCDLSQVHISLKFQLKNNSNKKHRADLKWQFTLPPCIPFVYDQNTGNKFPCEQGELPRRQRQSGHLVFSLDSKRLDSPNNRLVIISLNNVTPRSVYLAKDEADQQTTTVSFSVELPAGASQEITIELNYHVLLRRQVSNTIFLVARPDEQQALWQGAVAAAMSWVDRLETCRDAALNSLGFCRFAPFLWFDREKPLPDQILRFLHNMSSLQRIVVFGEVLRHDLENLLTALLDKGTNQQLRLQIFTCDEYYRDQVNALRGNIQARMIVADELPQRVGQLEDIVSVSFVSDPDLLPLAVRQFVERVSANEFFANSITPQERDAFLVSSKFDEARFLSVACVPIARHLAAPVLLWNSGTADETLSYLKSHRVQRLFLVGQFSAADEAAIRTFLMKEKEDSNRASIAIERIPYQDPVNASAALARLSKAHMLFNWLIQTLCAEREKLDHAGITVADVTRDYIRAIRGRRWAERLWSFLQAIVDNEVLDDKIVEQLLSVHQEIVIGRDEFVTSFKDHFTKVAKERKELLDILSPVWNDMVVLSDFDPKNKSNLNIFPAACLAAYHEAPLLMFSAITEEKEEFIERRVRKFEHQFSSIKNQSKRDLIAVTEAYQADIEEDRDLARLIFPSDVMAAMQSLNPLTVALYSTDINVPYEVISDSNGPMFLKYAMGHLSGTDAYETSIITASGMLYGQEMQHQKHLRQLLCMANIPGTPTLELDQEQINIYIALNTSSKDYLASNMLK